ncbi:hypothetical protein QBC39DRAFT_346181 [Podospora conica]|nr:hypothetical protein QBC39DRAFT_346181 [Schizothecium conicum]
MASYRIAAPDEYLAITGMNVKTVKITKAAWVWPFQRCMRFSVQPHDYSMNLQAMTMEKLQFLLPVVFTIGPDVNSRGANTPRDHHHRSSTSDNEGLHDREDRGDALMKFAMLLADSGNKQGKTKDTPFLEGIVKGIIEGETRVLVSSMTMEAIFGERELFKKRIFKNIQSELDQFGLKIYNANVKELKDAPESVYFASLSRKAHEGATNQARIDVASAQLRGNVGEAQKRGEQDREIAKINAETAVQKTERDIERARAEAVLATRKTELTRDVEIAQIQASRATESRDEELKRDVEIKRAMAEMERLRAKDVVKATILRESQQQAADAKAYEVEAEARASFARQQQDADGAAYRVKADTDASVYRIQQDADARNYAALKDAEAELQRKVKEAQGLAAMADAYARMGQALGGPAGLLQYMMIEKGTYVELAKANATAIHGLQPKISVWNTGAEAGGAAGAGGEGQGSAAAMRNIYQMLPPLMTTINEQTGITLPEWQFGRLNPQMANLEGHEVSKPNGKR